MAQKTHEAVFDFGGVEVKYDPSLMTDWKWQHAMAKGPSQAMAALDALFLGRSDELADELEEAGLVGDKGTMGAINDVVVALTERLNLGN